MPTIKETMTLEEYKKKIREHMLEGCEPALANRLMQISEDIILECYEDDWSVNATATGIEMGLI